MATPETIFASGVAHHSPSLRPEQTVTPLADKLRLPLDPTYTRRTESALVAAAVAAGGNVLVSWQHEAIPEIAELILGGTTGVPPHWPDHRFDLVWVFDRPGGTGTWSFTQVPRLLLADDDTATLPVP